MGFEIAQEVAIWQQYRGHFPVTANLIYLNHAAVAPLSTRTSAAMKSLADDVCQFGSFHYDQWLETYDGVRAVAAKLIGSTPAEIALVKNTSEGVSTVALGIDWKVGDKIVCFTEEFPANYFPWKMLEARGVRIEYLDAAAPLEQIDEAAKGARLLAISFVQYLSGHRADLVALGEICRRHDCFFFVDAIQGLGAFPIDVEAARIDALAADGHKWLLGPEGCGILYVREERLDEIRPVEVGWTNFLNFGDYERSTTWRKDAGRYECGTLNTIGCHGLRAAIEFLLEIGIDRIGGQVQALGDRIALGAAGKGYELLGSRRGSGGSGIVSFRKPGIDSRLVVRRLKEERILAAPRHGWVRTSPHFYISPEEIDRVVELLP